MALQALRCRDKLRSACAITMKSMKLLLTGLACSFALALPAQAINTVEPTPDNTVATELHSPENATLMANTLWGD